MAHRLLVLLGLAGAVSVAAAQTPGNSARVVAVILDSGSIIEDLAWDASGRRFIVSDVRRHRLRSVGLDGQVQDFGPAMPPGWALLGVAVDESRGALWATTVTLPQALGWTPADSGQAAILRLDLRTGALLRRYDLPGRSRAAPGDLAIAPDHDLIAGDGMIGAVYVIGAADTLETLVATGRMRSTQQPVVVPGGRTILIPWYGRGIMRVDRASGDLIGLLTPPAGVSLVGLDGLVGRGRDLIAVYNGDNPNAILRLVLDDAGAAVTRVDTLAAGPGLDDLTHVAVVGSALYAIVHAGWSGYEDNGTVKAGRRPEPPRIVRIAIPD